MRLPGGVEKIVEGVEERTGLRTLWHWLSEEELPGGSRWAYVFGSLLAALLVVQAASGVVLAFDYAPTVDAAHASVARLMDPEQAPFGPLVRGLHHFGASFLIVLLVLHLVQVAWAGAYRRPREANWLTGLALAGVLFGFAFTGYLLPWDQTAYYATRVGLNITASSPIIGEPMATLLQGGAVMGNLTLTRFYVIHVVLLPGALLALFGLHFALFRRRGVTPILDASGQVPPKRQPFWPNQAAKDAVAVLLVLGALVALAALKDAPLGAKADPSAPFDARPEWYFYWLFQLLHFFEPPYDWIGTMAIPCAIATFLVLLPWLDRGADRRPSARKLPLLGLSAVLALVGVLTAWVFVADATKAEAPEEAAVAEDRRAGAAVSPMRAGLLFGKKCTECHQISGAPEDPDAPDFRDPEFARAGRRDFARLVEVVQKGGEIMPAFEEELSDAEIQAILDHVVLKFAENAGSTPAGEPAPTAPAAPTAAPAASAPAAPVPSEAEPRGEPDVRPVQADDDGQGPAGDPPGPGGD